METIIAAVVSSIATLGGIMFGLNYHSSAKSYNQGN